MLDTTHAASYRNWCTRQISNHLPLWAKIKMDFKKNYLESFKTNAKPLNAHGA